MNTILTGYLLGSIWSGPYKTRSLVLGYSGLGPNWSYENIFPYKKRMTDVENNDIAMRSLGNILIVWYHGFTDTHIGQR